MSTSSSETAGALLVPQVKADDLSPPLEAERNSTSTKRKLTFDGSWNRGVGSSPIGDRTPSPLGATRPAALHLPLSFMAGRKPVAPPVLSLFGRCRQTSVKPPAEPKCTTSFDELLPRLSGPDNKFAQGSSAVGVMLSQAGTSHLPASPLGLPGGERVLYPPDTEDTLEEEFEFLDWYHAPDPVWWVALIPVPNNVEDKVGRDWFLPLIHRESHLTQDHMDAILHLLVQKCDTQLGPGARKWAILELSCWGPLTQPHYSDCREILIPYVMGRIPSLGGPAWKDADRVFGIGELSSNHWILYEICKAEEVVKVYDPMSNHQSPSAAKNKFFSMSYHLADLHEEAGIQFHYPRAQRWRVLNIKAPQQERYCDGGFMVFEYLKCLLKGASVYSASPSVCNRARLRYCASLFKFGMDWLVRSV